MAQMQLVFAKQSLQFKNLLDSYAMGNSVVDNDKVYNPYDMQEITSSPDTVGMTNIYQMMDYIQQNNISRLNGMI